MYIVTWSRIGRKQVNVLLINDWAPRRVQSLDQGVHTAGRGGSTPHLGGADEKEEMASMGGGDGGTAQAARRLRHRRQKL